MLIRLCCKLWLVRMSYDLDNSVVQALQEVSMNAWIVHVRDGIKCELELEASILTVEYVNKAVSLVLLTRNVNYANINIVLCHKSRTATPGYIKRNYWSGRSCIIDKGSSILTLDTSYGHI